MKKFLITVVNLEQDKIMLDYIRTEKDLIGSDYEKFLNLNIGESGCEQYNREDDYTDFDGITTITRIA